MARAVKTAPSLAGPGRRFVGFLLEIALCVLTLGLGWLVWSVAEWRHGRTPAKRLLRLQVADARGWYPPPSAPHPRIQACDAHHIE